MTLNAKIAVLLKIHSRLLAMCLISAVIIHSAFLTSASANTSEESSSRGLLDMSLEELLNINVQSSSFFQMEKNRAPGYVTIIDEEDVHESSVRTLADAINHFVPGAQSSRRFFGALVGQRGISIDVNSKTAVLLDGTNLNQRTHMGYMLPLLLPFLNDMERIEVFNGPSGLVHGTGAISGYINLIPKNGRDHPGLESQVEWGIEEQLFKTEISYGGFGKNSEWFAYLGMITSDGLRPSQEGPLGLTKSNDSTTLRTKEFPDGLPDQYDHFGAFAPVNWKASFNWRWNNLQIYTEFMDVYLNVDDLIDGPNGSRGLEWIIDKNGNRTFIEAVDRDYPITRTHTHLLLRPKYKFEFSSDESLEFVGSFYVVDSGTYDTDRGYKEIHPGENPLRAHNIPSEIEYSLKTIYRKTISAKYAFAAGGAVSSRTFYDQKSFFKSEGLGVELRENGREQSLREEGIFSWLEYSAFSEFVYSPGSKTTVLVGGRYDGVRYFDEQFRGSPWLWKKSHSAFSPRFSIAYELEEGESIKFSYQRGFRNPDMANMEKGAVGNVEPEKMDSFEVNYSFSKEKSVHWDLNAYFNRLHNTIGWNSGANNGFANMPESFSVFGTEVILNYAPDDNREFFLIYSYSRPVDFPKEIAFESDFKGVIHVNEDRSVFSNFPAHQIKTAYLHRFFNGKLLVNLSLNQWYQKDDISYMKAHPAYKSSRTELDLALRYKISDSLALKLIGQNLTEDTHALPHYNSGATKPPVGWGDRVFYLQLQYQFK